MKTTILLNRYYSFYSIIYYTIDLFKHILLFITLQICSSIFYYLLHYRSVQAYKILQEEFLLQSISLPRKLVKVDILTLLNLPKREKEKI